MLYLSAMVLIFVIAFTVSIICLNLINSSWFSIPMSWLALNIFANPILDYVKQKYK